MKIARSLQVQLLPRCLLLDLHHLLWNVKVLLALNHRFLLIVVKRAEWVQSVGVRELAVEALITAYESLLCDLLNHWNWFV